MSDTTTIAVPAASVARSAPPAESTAPNRRNPLLLARRRAVVAARRRRVLPALRGRGRHGGRSGTAPANGAEPVPQRRAPVPVPAAPSRSSRPPRTSVRTRSSRSSSPEAASRHEHPRRRRRGTRPRLTPPPDRADRRPRTDTEPPAAPRSRFRSSSTAPDNSTITVNVDRQAVRQPARRRDVRRLLQGALIGGTRERLPVRRGAVQRPGDEATHHRLSPRSADDWWPARHSGQARCVRAGSARIRRMLRWLTAGESHGPALVAILEGLPAGVRVTTDDIADALARRRLGYGRGARMKFEQDEVELLGGVRHGLTLGGPVAIRIGNTEWPKWETVMAADPVDPRDARRAGPQRAADPAAARPRRPGRDAEVRLRRRPAGARAGQRPRDRRPGGARRGGRGLPATRRSASGCVSHVVAIGAGRRRPTARRARPGRPGARSTPTRCAASTRRRAPRWSAEIDAAQQGRRHPRRRRRGARLRPAAGPGQPRALGPPARLPAGRRADGHPGDQGRRGRRRLRTAPRAAARQAHDEIERGADGGIRRRTGRAGGTEGGMTTGERAAGPRRDEADLDGAAGAATPSTSRPARPPRPSTSARDVCAVPAAGVVAEAMVALVLADAVLEKFGGDSVAETAPQRRGLPRPPAAVTASERRGVVLVGPPGPASPRWPRRVAERARRRRSATPTPTSRPARAADRRHLRRRRRGALPRAGARPRSPPRSPSTTACSRSAAARCSTPATRAALAGHAGGLPRRRARRRRRAGRPRTAPAAAAGQPARQWRQLHGGAPADLRGVADVTVGTDGRHRRRGRRRGRRWPGRRLMAPWPATTGSAGRAGGAGPYDVVVGHGLLGELPGLLGDGARRVPSSTPQRCARPRAARRRRCWPRGLRRARCSPVPDGEAAKTRRGRGRAAGRRWARPASPAPTPSSASAGEPPPTWPGSSPRPGCAACGSCRCRPRCSAWSTPRSAARPASTPPRARTWSAPSTRRPACCATWPRWRRCRAADLVSGPGRGGQGRLHRRPARSSTCSRPTRRPRRTRRSHALRELVERAVRSRPTWSPRTCAEVAGLRGDPQLRAHPRPRDRAGRALPLAARRRGRRRHGLRRRARPAGRPARTPTSSTGTARSWPRSACRRPTRGRAGRAARRHARRQEDPRRDCCASSSSTGWRARPARGARPTTCSVAAYERWPHEHACLVLNGPNLGRLGTPRARGLRHGHLRRPRRGVRDDAGEELGLDVEVRQTDDEAELVGWLHEAADARDAGRAQPGGVHALLLRAARRLAPRTAPLVEVHLSNPAAREEFRHTSRWSPASPTGTIAGFGLELLRAGAAGASRSRASTT